jgi:hypothetical protein
VLRAAPPSTFFALLVLTAAFERVFVEGETVPAVVATFSPPLAYDPRWAGPTLAHERRAAIERLAQRLAHGGFMRGSSACAIRASAMLLQSRS